MRIVFAAIVMLFCLPVFSEAKPNLHPSVLDSAALVVIDTGSFGSGVYVNTDKFSYFITAKHVLYDEKGKLRGNHISLINNNELYIDLTATPKESPVGFSKSYDIAYIKLGDTKKDDKTGEIRTYLSPGITKKLISPPTPIVGANLTDIVKYENVGVSNNVFMVGYPMSLSQNDDNIERTKPLLRRGIVAGKNSIKHIIIIDSPAYPGNSGGPVYEEDVEIGRIKLMGVVTEFVPLIEKLKSNLFGYENTNVTNSGYAIVVPFDDILEIINK